MTPSSEEIAAALTYAIRVVLWHGGSNAVAIEPGPKGADGHPNAAQVLTAHLSRLREEERFRDAAMEWNRLREEISAFREPCSHVEEYSDLSAAHTKAEKAMRAAYRALEEPRDE